MMTRLQRIEFEILDCALNRPNNSDGYTTTVNMFVTRLQHLFPNVDKQEFREACKGLVRQKAIEVNLPRISYRGADDDAEFLAAKMMLLKPASLSEVHFRRLSALIVPPASFKQVPGFSDPANVIMRHEIQGLSNRISK